MRNLKKFLALVMAMVMAFSLMLSASAANPVKTFDDADQITEAFVEAADVLTGMKVFQGDEGGFRPADTITRAEVAALIYRLATGDVDDNRAGAYANYGNFADVAESDWFAGYVGFCANAGYIKGHGGYFNPYDSVTGYEALAMILRAIGYDKNGEFTGATWETNVSALATQLGILKNIKTTHYGNTLYLASRRDVVAELLFQADAKVPMVIYTPAFGYQPYGMTNPDGGTGSLVGGGSSTTNPTLGERVFGLAMNDTGVLIGNQQTGETGSVMGYKGTARLDADGNAATNPANYNEYAWAGAQLTADAKPAVVPKEANIKYELESGIDLIGHNLKLWYDNGNGIVSNNKKHVFAYFDLATKVDVVKADDTKLLANAADTDTQLGEAAVKAGFTLNDDTAPDAVFNNSFGKFGSGDKFATNATEFEIGNGRADVEATAIASPVKLYKLISNGEINGHKNSQVDAVIALNIETSRITESNVIRNVHTLGMPVGNDGTENAAADWDGTVAKMNDLKVGAQLQTTFIDGDDTTDPDKNEKKVGIVWTGVIAKDAVVGNSTTALGNYEMGIHITGTSPRTVSNEEHIAINGKGQETSRYLLHKVEATVEGKVVAYNATNGTVTLDNGTVLNRSKYYNTVVNTAQNKTRQAVVDANGLAGTDAYALPQSIDAAGNESYNFANYKFYTDYEGKYLGAERTYGNDFLYATYVDYAQDTSSSAYIYKVTGVDMNGEVKTVDVSKFWADETDGDDGIAAGKDTMYNAAKSFGVGAGKGGTPAAPTSYGWADNTGANRVASTSGRTNYTMTGTNNLGVPFRDTWGSNGQMNYIGAGVYRGMTISSGVASPYYTNPLINNADYGMNMQRLGIQNAAVAKRAAAGDLFNKAILIGEDQITLGVVETVTEGIDGAAAADRSNLFFNEETKFILVDGYGTANIVHEVYDGISELKGDANYVTIDFNATRARKAAGAAPYAIDLTGKGTDTWTVMGGEAGTVTADSRITESADWNAMTYFTSSAFTYDQTGATAKKVNTIILPKQAVYWDTTTSTSYYMGNPQPTLVSSHEGTPIYQYTVYNKGVARNVWLTNAPGDDLDDTTDAVTTARTAPVKNDTFLTLGNEVGKTDSGEPYYTATFDAAAKSNDFVNATTDKANKRISGNVAVVTTATPFAKGAITSVLTYSATTREAQAGTFTLTSPVTAADKTMLLRVVEANVTNLNAADSPKIGTGATAASGYVWPDITDVASLNAAASINPVTGMSVRVAIEREGLKVTQVYVCWDQNLT